MALTEANLVGYLKAQYRKSAGLRVWQFLIQLAIAIPAALSVVVTSNNGSYILAIAGAILLAVWWYITNAYLAAKSGADTARRAALIAGGIDVPFTPTTTLELTERMKVTKQQATAAEQPTYYASKKPVGPERLAEMIEESAFYSAPLQRASAKAMAAAIIVLVVIAGGVVLSTVPFVEHDAALLIFRLILSGFVFAMSSDVLGAYFTHRDAAKAIDDVRHRLANAAGIGYPLSDVMLAMTDYNAAVASAPESVPWAYKLMEPDLNTKWDEYQHYRDSIKASISNPVDKI